MVKAVQPEAEVSSASSTESPNTQGKPKRQTKIDKLKIINPEAQVEFKIDLKVMMNHKKLYQTKLWVELNL